MSHTLQIPDFEAASGVAKPGMISFVRPDGMPGVEIMDVRHISRKWSYFHETYSFCVLEWVADPRDVGWRYRSRTHQMRPQGVQLMEPGELHSNIDVAPVADFRVLMLTPGLVQGLLRDLGAPDRPPHLAVAQLYGGSVRAYVSQLTQIAVEDDDPERIELGIYRLIENLWQLGHFETQRPLGDRQGGRKAVQVAREVLHSAWNEHVPMARLTREAKLPLATLERAFRETFGTSPRQYQHRMRLMRGKELLRQTVLSVAEIAKLCGFRDPKYFVRLFKREFGLLPAHYRRPVDRLQRG